MDSPSQPESPKISPIPEATDPLRSIMDLVRQGKISANEADRIRAALETGAMTPDQVGAYVRQKTR